MKRFTKFAMFAALVLSIVMVAGAAVSAATLKDIERHWAKSYIEYGVEKGYISGYEDGTFLPDKAVTRAEFSKMINNAINITSYGTSRGDFTDVDTEQWYFNEVRKAEYAGYITGYEDGSFKPSNKITRQEAAVILSRLVLPTAERAELSSFKDGASIDSWATDAVCMIAAKGYIKGDENGNFLPKGALTRSQAAKLICEFVKNENIKNDNLDVESEEEVIFSEIIFTDDVVINVPAGTEVTLKNCRVLGNLSVASENAVIVLETTAVKEITFDKPGAEVTLDKSSTIKKANVENNAEISGSGKVTTVEIDGEDLTAVVIKADADTVEVDSNAVVTLGDVDKLDVNAKVNLVVTAGKIKSLTAEKAAKDSTINLASKNVAVEKATNKAVVSYSGTGSITKSQNDVEGVSYGDVTVGETTGKNAAGTSTGTAAKVASDFFEGMEVTPSKGKTGVTISSNIYLSLDGKIFDKKGEAVDADYLEDNIELRKSSATGNKVTFTAKISSSKSITIDPKSALSNGTKYYVVIPEGVFTNSVGELNCKYSTYFTTVSLDGDEEDKEDEDEDENASVTMSPKNGAEDVSVSSTIKLTFSGTLKASSGTLNEEYIEEDAIEIHEGTKDGDTVKFTAAISGKTITLNPSRLLGNTSYYVVILGSKLKVGGSTLSKTTLSFTTEEATAITITPGNGETGVSLTPEITVSFAEPMLQMDGESKLTEKYIKDEVLYIKKGSTKDSAEDVYYNVTIAENNRSFTIVLDGAYNTELEAGSTYYIIIEEDSLFGEITETENDKVTSSFKTASAMAPMFDPYDGKQNVDVGDEIRISFSDTLLTYEKNKDNRVEVDDEYLDTLINGYDSNGKTVGKNRISLKRVGDSSSRTLPITATIEDGKIIVITPDEALVAEKKYTISIEKNLFYSVSSDGKTYKANTSGSATFNTNIAMSPSITPKNEAKDVSVTVNPVITFNEMIYNKETDELKELKSVYVKKTVIDFFDEDNNEVEFDVDISVSGSKSTITIEPKEDLESNYQYTIRVNAGTLQNEDGVPNLEKEVTFKTKISNTIEVTPGSNEKMVSPNAIPTVKFGTVMLTEDGEEVDDKYASEYIFLTEGSKSTDVGDAVPAEVTTKDGRTFTITPDYQLDFNTKYYINVVEKKFLYADEETKNKASSTYFTTIPEPELKKCTAAPNNKTSVKITYTSNVADSSEDKLAKLVVEGGPEAKEFNITSTSSNTVTISGLTAGTEYTFTVYVVYDGEFESEVKEVTAKTKS